MVMAPEADSAAPRYLGAQRRQMGQQEEEAVEGVEEAETGTPTTHHPIAPPDEVFDISTTIDPSYIISLIRKLLPPGETPLDEPQTVSALDSHSNRSNADHMDEGRFLPENGVIAMPDENKETMDTCTDDLNQSPTSEGNEDDSCHRIEPSKQSAREKAWEEFGCILWDLAANKSHAELMVENLLLEVLLANFMTPQSARITEISLGIIGNLACHEDLMKKIISMDRLMAIITDQLFSDDTLCLCEVCRVMTLGLQGNDRIVWASALQSENILSRILWIAENTLNPQLIEKIIGLLLVIMENQHQVGPMLLPLLLKLGLPDLLVNLLAFEMGKLKCERRPERYPAIDSILRAIEGLSIIDDYCQEICSNKELFQMVSELVKLPDKTEIASFCVTAAVLVANMLTDSKDLALEMSKDLLFLQCLFDLFPFTSDDVEAREALWSIVARLLVPVQETEMSPSSLCSYVAILVNKLELIEDDLLDYPLVPSNETVSLSPKYKCRTSALKKIIGIANQWNSVKDSANVEALSRDNYPDEKESTWEERGYLLFHLDSDCHFASQE